MKLGLLVVVAVAVLLPSFSESRVVSRCELRDKLQKMIRQPRRLEERILATVICEVDRRSHLDTSSVSVFGNRITTTPKPTVITTPSTTGASKVTTATTNQPTSATSTTTQLTNTTTATPANTTTTNTTTTNTNTTTDTNTTTTITTNTNTTTDTNTTNTTTTTTTNTTTNASTNTTTSPATTNSTIGSMNTTLVSNSTGRARRRKREADSSSGEDVAQYDSQMAVSAVDPGYAMNPWSLGLYGLFQLSDGEFCDSGYRQSQNECRTSCTAFIDDDITDDIACVINTGYWRQILEGASDSCRHTSNFFKECK